MTTLETLKRLCVGATPGKRRFERFVGADGRDGYAVISDDPKVGVGYGITWIEQAQLPKESDGMMFAACDSETIRTMAELLEEVRPMMIKASCTVPVSLRVSSKEYDEWLSKFDAWNGGEG